MRRVLAVPLAVLLALAGPARAQEGEGWERYLPGLAPALRACLLEAPAGTAVALAWPAGPGLAGALLRLPGGGRAECVAEVATGRVARRRDLPAGEREPGEEVRRFTLERGCADARRVEGEGGAVLGWLGYPGCG